MERTQHQNGSVSIAERVVSSEEFRNAETIGITISRFPEIETRPIIESAWRAGKRVVVPKCIHATREMDFRSIQNL